MDQELPDQTPPKGYEPQVEQTPQNPRVYEKPDDLISDADEVSDEDAKNESGDADDGDDDAEDSNDS